MIYQNGDLPIYLFSTSPRRRDLLSSIGIDFEIIPPTGEDANFKYKSPRFYCQILAEKKLFDTLKINPIEKGFIISADTIVSLKKNIIEKPTSLEDAISILSKLEGKWHSVFTSYCIYMPHIDKKVLRTVRTYVKFKKLKMKEIKNYIKNENVLDKAGAYAFQGLGSFMIEKIEGSPTNVIGLPLTEVITDLLNLKAIKYKV